jgi:hypothetical protein
MSEIGTGLQNATGIRNAIARAGYAFVEASDMRTALGRFGSLADWAAFADRWNDLSTDTHMADGGRYRRRRHAVFEADAEGITRAPHQPHFQALDYNPLNGGVARWFEPIVEDIGCGQTLRTVLTFCHSFFGGLAPAVLSWRVEVHQFRIQARPGEAGQPTPEGLHRDGVDYVLVLLVRRRNIASGTTSVHGRDGERLGDFTLTEPLDAALLDDTRVAHGVTAVHAIDPTTPAYRDVLVVTLADAASRPAA